MKHACIVVLLLAAAGCVSVSSQTNLAADFSGIRSIAVAQIAGRIRGSAQGQVSDLYEEALHERGYRTIGILTAASRLRRSGIDDADLAVAANLERAREVLDVDALLLIDIPRADQRVDMDARVIDARTGQLLWSASGTADTQRNTIFIASVLLAATAGAIIGKEVTDEDAGAILGGISGGIIGGMAGRALAPDAMQMMRKFVRKITKDFPDRRKASPPTPAPA